MQIQIWEPIPNNVDNIANTAKRMEPFQINARDSPYDIIDYLDAPDNDNSALLLV